MTKSRAVGRDKLALATISDNFRPILDSKHGEDLKERERGSKVSTKNRRKVGLPGKRVCNWEIAAKLRSSPGGGLREKRHPRSDWVRYRSLSQKKCSQSKLLSFHTSVCSVSSSGPEVPIGHYYQLRTPASH